MTKAKQIRLIYGILLSLSLIVAGICLMGACLRIYLSGDRPFSREAVAQSFSGIAVPVYTALAMTVLGFILDFALPVDKKKKKPGTNYAGTLQHQWKKRDLTNCSQELKALILCEQHRRRSYTLLSLLLLGICGLFFLGYALSPKNFLSSDINRSIIEASCLLLICLAVPFAYAVYAAGAAKKSMAREIEYVKQLDTCASNDKQPSEKDRSPVLRWTLLGLALVLLVYGYFSGGTLDVLTKAVNICTECVGLG